MRLRITTRGIVLLLTLIFTPFGAASSQKNEASQVGKKGTFHITSTVRIGSVMLEPGMYEVEHTVETGDHLLIFRKIKMGELNPKGFGAMTRVNVTEVARIRCAVEQLSKRAKPTKLILIVNASGAKEARAVQIAGENVRYVL